MFHRWQVCESLRTAWTPMQRCEYALVAAIWRMLGSKARPCGSLYAGERTMRGEQGPARREMHSTRWAQAWETQTHGNSFLGSCSLRWLKSLSAGSLLAPHVLDLRRSGDGQVWLHMKHPRDVGPHKSPLKPCTLVRLRRPDCAVLDNHARAYAKLSLQSGNQHAAW